jgi:hypothetical protein
MRWVLSSGIYSTPVLQGPASLLCSQPAHTAHDLLSLETSALQGTVALPTTVRAMSPLLTSG